MVYITNSERETEALGERFGAAVTDGSVAALYGDLGCGKTAFVRGMARGMGLDVPVTSPTFTIVNEYIGSRSLFHFDMYRLSDAEELYDIGWEDYLGRNGVCAVEWSENVSGAFEGDEYVIRFSKLSDTQREISIEGGPQKC
ncbi:MAG: tRNA (adenosine(37)-N6)-threonylcarbamoyltransferase complex ATPase subunit type 1 TsaE [Oscillospiraceae bacterium]|nr:tRNA (adenosine(37)-N6)-threonylcarbamoyltransferase complex ATPase subunit type 1 TsaE [Oscillospiraceae bacterium]